MLPAIDTTLNSIRGVIDLLLEAGPPYSWENLAAPLERELERLQRVWSPVSHTNSMISSEALRAAHNACRPKLSAFETELGQHEGLDGWLLTLETPWSCLWYAVDADPA